MASKRPAKTKAAAKRWSQNVTERSDALDLETRVFTLKDPKKIAASLKRSAEASTRRKADPFRSAMSMLVFYINRAGKNLTEADRARPRTSCARPSAKAPSAAYQSLFTPRVSTCTKLG